MDGLSITNGHSRKHLLSFVAGHQENTHYNSGYHNCPCTTGSQHQSPSVNTFHSNDRLWDGEQCGVIEKGCCNVPGLPWFHRTLSSSTNDFIELRLCCNEGTSNEDVPVGLYENYTK